MKPRTRILACTLALALGACLTQHDLDKPPPGAIAPEPPHLEIRREKDKNGALVHEWSVLVQRGAKAIKHGEDRTWYANGAKEWEREYDHDAKTGIWRKWHENGQPASETTFAGPDVERPMHFWYDNGLPSADGFAKNGVRCGHWKYWRPDGSLREEGSYVDSLREGAWNVWSEETRTKRVVHYSKNVLVGDSQ